MHGSATRLEADGGCICCCLQSERFLKRYLEYARTAVAPAVSRRAGETLAAEYVSLREEVRILWTA